MSKVSPTARQFVVAAGTAGLAAVGAVAGAVSAHGAEYPTGLPLSTNAVGALKGLMEHNHGKIAGMPMQDIPVLGQLPSLLGVLPTDNLPGLSGLGMASPGGALSPATRARPHTAVPATPATVPAEAPRVVPQSAASMPQSAAKTGASSPLDGVTGLTDMLPMKLPLGGLEKSLPIGGLKGGLPVLGSLPLTGSLPGLGGGGLLGGLPLGGGLGHLAG